MENAVPHIILILKSEKETVLDILYKVNLQKKRKKNIREHVLFGLTPLYY